MGQAITKEIDGRMVIDAIARLVPEFAVIEPR